MPPISNTWGNFGGSEETEQGEQPYCGRNICKLASLITADRKPTLYMVHSLLPHVPWLYLPSGKRYGGDVRVIPGAPNGTWGDDKWLTEQAEQRFFLQLGYADGALGLLLRRLRATGVYDRALVIVTADHGVSFRPGTPRRNISAGNLADIAFMPLFVKLPGQHARTDRRLVRPDDRRPPDDRRRAAHEAAVARRRQTADRTEAAARRNGTDCDLVGRRGDVRTCALFLLGGAARLPIRSRPSAPVRSPVSTASARTGSCSTATWRLSPFARARTRACT